MTELDQAERRPPSQRPMAEERDPSSAALRSGPSRAGPVSAKGMFGRGLLLIMGEMVQLVLALALVLFALACCVALAVEANDAYHFMGARFTTPHAVTDMLGGLLGASTTFLVLSLLAAIFGLKLLDLTVRVLRRRARLAEIRYSAVPGQI